MDRQQEFTLRDIIEKFVGRTSAAGESEVDSKTLENVEYAGEVIGSYLYHMLKYARCEYDRHEGSMHDIGAKKFEIIQEMHQMFNDFMDSFEDIPFKSRPLIIQE